MVFVDALRRTTPAIAWRWRQSAHLCADTLAELHAFAAALGLRSEWFQPASRPHYDLTPKRHTQALKAGAILLERRVFMQRLRAIERANTSL